MDRPEKMNNAHSALRLAATSSREGELPKDEKREVTYENAF